LISPASFPSAQCVIVAIIEAIRLASAGAIQAQEVRKKVKWTMKKWKWRRKCRIGERLLQLLLGRWVSSDPMGFPQNKMARS
jgi:hypothetical protein